MSAHASGLARTEPKRASRRPHVVFFDYWTKGSFHFTDLIARAEPGRADFTLFHLGSWRDPTVPRRERIRGLECVDIAEFPGWGLERILKFLNPSVVVGLNIHSLCDRGLLLTCRRLRVPTVFLQHGAWADPDNFALLTRQMDKRITLWDRTSRLPKFLRTLPWYFAARSGSRFAPEVYRMIWRSALRPATSHFFPSKPEELWPDLALVLNQASADLLIETHRLPAERVRVVGNPELDPVIARLNCPLDGATRRDMIISMHLDPSKPIVCHIEDGFVEQQNCFGWTASRRIGLIRELLDACENSGVQLLVRPHPATDTAPIVKAFKDLHDVSVSRTLPLLDMLDISTLVIGTMSTAMETAFVLRKPLLVPLWHIQGQAAMSPYLRFGVAAAINAPAELIPAICDATSGAKGRRDDTEFIRRRLGPIEGSANVAALHEILNLVRNPPPL